MFKDMIDTINRKTVAILMRGQIPVREPEQVREAAPEVRQVTVNTVHKKIRWEAVLRQLLHSKPRKDPNRSKSGLR